MTQPTKKTTKLPAWLTELIEAGNNYGRTAISTEAHDRWYWAVKKAKAEAVTIENHPVVTQEEWRKQEKELAELAAKAGAEEIVRLQASLLEMRDACNYLIECDDYHRANGLTCCEDITVAVEKARAAVALKTRKDET